jgi:putative transposase
LCLLLDINDFFCKKYSKNLLNDDAVNFLKNVCSEVAERYPFEFDAIGCDCDHVHLFAGAEPSISL